MNPILENTLAGMLLAIDRPVRLRDDIHRTQQRRYGQASTSTWEEAR